MRRHACQLIMTFVLAVLIDVVGGLHIKTLVRDDLTLAVATVIVSHYLAFFGLVWFIDETSYRRRFALASSAAFGAATGTFIVVRAF